MGKYILGIDQSTQGTKALLFDGEGRLRARTDLAHRQITNEKGWVEHDPEEIYANTLQAVKAVVEQAGIDKASLAGVGISNQRETSLVWEETGKPCRNAIVWQDSRAETICETLRGQGRAEWVRRKTGIPLSPYFPAAKLSWILKELGEEWDKSRLYMGTMDTYLVFRLTGGKEYRTDYSNASRTQLFHIEKLCWDEELCRAFDIPIERLARVTDSDGCFGETDFEGYLEHAIPIHGVLGDSHGALLGQGCTGEGMVKTTYGTGSSVMMNIGNRPVFSEHGLVTSLAWKLKGRVSYVLEGNINYTGAVITWMKDDLGLLQSAAESEALAAGAAAEDKTYLVPAFTGLGAPHWDSGAVGVFYGMSRTTGRAELVRAGLESIAYQIRDILKAMEADAGMKLEELRADGGPTKNGYLMQFQSDICRIPVKVARVEELSGMGAAYAAGAALGIYRGEEAEEDRKRKSFLPLMKEETAGLKCAGWQRALEKALSKGES